MEERLLKLEEEIKSLKEDNEKDVSWVKEKIDSCFFLVYIFILPNIYYPNKFISWVAFIFFTLELFSFRFRSGKFSLNNFNKNFWIFKVKK